jgi:hypothetical protein
VTHYGPDVQTFLGGVAAFGRYLNLQLPDLNLTPPPTQALPAQQPPPANTMLPTVFTPNATGAIQPTLNAPTIVSGSIAQAAASITQQHVRSYNVAQVLDASATAQAVIFDFGNTGSFMQFENPFASLSGFEKSKHQATSGATPIQFFSTISRSPVRKPVTSRSPAVRKPDAVSNVTQPKNLHSPNFDDLSGFWTGKSRKALRDLTPGNFGWNKGSGQSRDQLFQFSAARDLTLAGTAVDWVNDSFVKGELLKRAPAFKRAIVVLLIQAESADHDVSLPPLLGDILAFIRKAAQMMEACGGWKDEGWTDWDEAGIFFHSSVYGSPKLIRGLCGHYDTEKWDEMDDLWESKAQNW